MSLRDTLTYKGVSRVGVVEVAEVKHKNLTASSYRLSPLTISADSLGVPLGQTHCHTQFAVNVSGLYVKK